MATRRKRPKRVGGFVVLAILGFRCCTELRHRVRWKEPVGRLETRPVPRGRGQGAKTGGDRRQVQDAVERHRRREQARHRLKLPSQDRCRAPRRAGHGCRESIPRVASSCRYLILLTFAANSILLPTLS